MNGFEHKQENSNPDTRANIELKLIYMRIVV
jgi:hypothetical protein